MSDRKAELERKKAKLEAMRQEKKRKEEERKRKEAVEAAQSTTNQADIATEADQLLKDLGIATSETASVPLRPAVATTVQGGPEGGDTSQATIPTAQHVIPSPQIQKKLMISKVSQTNIPPKEMVAYSKETQTTHEPVEREARSSWDYYVNRMEHTRGPMSPRSPRCGHGSPRHSIGSSRMGSPYSFGSPKFAGHLEWEDEFAQVLTYDHGQYLDDDANSMDAAMDTALTQRSHKMPHVEHIAPAVSQQDKEKKEKEEARKRVREISEEEKKQIMMSEEFQKFFDRTSRVMERALCEEDLGANIFVDYTGAEDTEGDKGGEKLKLNREFFDDRWTKHRTVTCMDWSQQHPELLVASYNNNEDAPHEPDGVALIWNVKFKKNTPESIFHCQSAVLSTCFAKFHPNIVVGGTYSGQIVVWDNRSNKRTPVQRTPLSAAAHTHPVYGISVVGTQNAHNLISVSTDGKICSWSLDMLSQPQDSMELQHKQSKAVAATGFSFLRDDVNNYVVGSEEGAVYTACRHGSKAGVVDVFEGHQGPITGIDCHCVPGPVDFSQHFLSSSFDWTVKLWSIRENKVLYSFEDNSDYVYDVKWSPVHPALFASVDGAGRLDIWNLNNDTEVPTASTVVGSNIALNRCRWHQLGHQIAVGDDVGRIHVYELGEQIASPRNDEWNKFLHTLQELRNNAADANPDDPSSLSSLSSTQSPLR